MSRRFFVSPVIAGKQAVLEGREAHHLLHVLRAEVGDRVILFDGTPHEYVAEVTRCQRSRVSLAVIERRLGPCELGAFIELGVALPKGDRQRWLVEKSVELGCGRLVPLVTHRGVAQPTSAACDRLKRTVIEASKQSGRNRLMELAPPTTWGDYVAADRSDSVSGSSGGETVRWLAEPSAEQSPVTADRRSEGIRLIRLAIGPEGGFTEEEVAMARAQQWKSIRLGPRILRVETAAVALVAYWSLSLLDRSDLFER